MSIRKVENCSYRVLSLSALLLMTLSIPRYVVGRGGSNGDYYGQNLLYFYELDYEYVIWSRNNSLPKCGLLCKEHCSTCHEYRA